MIWGSTPAPGELPGASKAAKQAAGLIWSYRAEICGLSSRYLSVRFHVLQDYLFLLQRLEAADSDVPSGRVQHPVDGCGQVPAPAFSLRPAHSASTPLLQPSHGH
jgi:hypothetical protein